MFRSREVTGEAFFRLMDLLRYVGHPVPRHRCRRLGAARHSYVRGFRRLPADSAEAWGALLRGISREALETLALRLLDHAGARARREETHRALRAVGRFFRHEARVLARVADRHRLRPLPGAPAGAGPAVRPLPGRGPDVTGLVKRGGAFRNSVRMLAL